MIEYVKANCVVPPLNSHPNYDDDTDTWDVWFEEKVDYNPYGLLTEPICIALDTLEEAQELIQKSLELAYDENEEDTQED